MTDLHTNMVITKSFWSRSHETSAHKICDMTEIVEDLRINVFDCGKYLRDSAFHSPSGRELEENLLNVEKVI